MNLLVPRELRDPAAVHVKHVRARLNRRIQRAAIGVLERYPSPARPLAEPPPGSGLKPVMGDYGPPWVGYLLSSLTDPIGFSHKRLQRYGPLHWAGGFGRPMVAIGNPEALEEVLLDRKKVFSAQRGWEFVIGPFFRGGLLLRDFDDHLYHRRILQQVFTRPRLDGYLELTSPLLASGIAGWRPGREFRLYDAVKELLLHQATVVFAGAELGPESARLSRAFEDSVHGGTAIVRASIPGGVWRKGLRGRRVLEEYFGRELPRRRAGDGTDLFSVLARVATLPEHKLTDDDVVAHMIFTMMAAHDTSAISISMLAYELARHPDWQERLRAESQALGKADIDYGDLARLPSLDLAFKEALRMYAPVAQQARETIADTEIMGHFVPKGTLVMTGPYAMMRQAEQWHDPDAFDPSRFDADHREDAAHRFAWAPFGGGAHKCIGLYFGGMTVKAVLHRMLLHYRWSVPEDYRVPLVSGTGPLPADGLPIRLERLPS
ncbi:cytochrome P450 [Nocardia uniformis]|uniref:Cytochrome P450 n=1 Tax=Nocardia uniformis TaxID=53432 RepID=A0A849CCF4_9NOCA|nr:cytochrome P450 [Nocardia uniformis]NNH70681.1 cytochrome P450 [Nocardia uniformis]